MRDKIRFVRRGRVVELSNVAPTETLLDYLRLREGACGTKEGCAEGDCGACTVAVGTPSGEGIAYRPVNACIQFLGMMDGKEIVAVEDIAGPEGPHPVQAAMVRHHGSQCGFCTPGIVMALFTLYHTAEGTPGRRQVTDWLAGNLCRCTGYRPIIDAARETIDGAPADRFALAAPETAELLAGLDDRQDVFIGDSDAFFAAPRTIASLAALYERHPDATLVAGGTDVGLWVTKQLRELPKIIHLGRVTGLQAVEDLGNAVLIGAGATYAAVERVVAGIDPDLGELWRRLGSRQVRAVGTVGGNIANGSPIGDTPPALIALGASLELRRGTAVRAIALEDFFVDYGKQDRGRGEFLTGILVPKLAENQHFRCFKVSKRFDQDISSVMGAFRITLRDGTITGARVAYGGMAGVPKRARSVEARLIGAQPGRMTTWKGAIEAIAEDFKPLTDMRASAEYRLDTARALLAKALVEVAGAPTSITRVTGRREALHDA